MLKNALPEELVDVEARDNHVSFSAGLHLMRAINSGSRAPSIFLLSHNVVKQKWC
jgi:hypothetical protein